MIKFHSEESEELDELDAFGINFRHNITIDIT